MPISKKNRDTFIVSWNVPATSEKHYQLTDSPTWIQEMLAHLKRQWYSRKYAFRPIFEKLLQQASHTKRRIIVKCKSNDVDHQTQYLDSYNYGVNAIKALQ